MSTTQLEMMLQLLSGAQHDIFRIATNPQKDGSFPDDRVKYTIIKLQDVIKDLQLYERQRVSEYETGFATSLPVETFAARSEILIEKVFEGLYLSGYINKDHELLPGGMNTGLYMSGGKHPRIMLPPKVMQKIVENLK